MKGTTFSRDLEQFGLVAATIEGTLEILLVNGKDFSLLDKVDISRIQDGKMFLSHSLNGLDSINKPSEFFLAGGEKENDPTCLNWALKTYIELEGFDASLDGFRHNCESYIEVLSTLLDGKIPSENVDETLTFFSAIANKSLAQDLKYAVGDY